MFAFACVDVFVDFAGDAAVLSFEACCGALDDEVLAAVLLLLLLDASVLFVEGSGGGGASCTLEEDDDEDDEAAAADGEDDDDGEDDGCFALCAAASFCESILCWRVCENGVTLAAAAAMAALVEVLLVEPSS